MVRQLRVPQTVTVRDELEEQTKIVQREVYVPQKEWALEKLKKAFKKLVDKKSAEEIQVKWKRDYDRKKEKEPSLFHKIDSTRKGVAGGL